jgi:hypothetical protein
MIIYSKKIFNFICDIESTVKEILSKEVRLKVVGNRFYDRRELNSYPIKIVIFNHKQLLGYFDGEFYELGFHEVLMLKTKEELKKVIKHELAHYITHINHEYPVEPHGIEFKSFCERMGWGEEIYRANVCLDQLESLEELEESPILRKVQKLMALSSSSNKNEAELAMIKSQQLLLKHNLDSTYLEDDKKERMVLKRVLKEKRISPKLTAIASILQTFFLSVIFSKQKEGSYIEILGHEVNVEIGEYVANFLYKEFDLLWQQTQKSSPHLKGLVAKNSFFTGIARGYTNKIEALKKEHGKETEKALIVLKKQLTDFQSIIYPHLSSKRSRRYHCKESSLMGEERGRGLNIHAGIKNTSKEEKPLLLFK